MQRCLNSTRSSYLNLSGRSVRCLGKVDILFIVVWNRFFTNILHDLFWRTGKFLSVFHFLIDCSILGINLLDEITWELRFTQGMLSIDDSCGRLDVGRGDAVLSFGLILRGRWKFNNILQCHNLHICISYLHLNILRVRTIPRWFHLAPIAQRPGSWKSN